MATKRKTKTTLKKPIPEYQNDPAYRWFDVVKWIEHKTGRDPHDWAGKHKSKKYDDKIPYQNMWHWICELHDASNDSYFHLTLDDEEISDDDEEHLFIREIFAVLREEFPEAEGEMYCYASW